MTLNIAIEGIDGTGKTTMVDRLVDYYRNHTKQSKYNYRVCKAVQPANKEIINILKNNELCSHEIALLMAFDRSLTYYNNNWSDYDLVFWDRSILSSYAYNTDKDTRSTFIKQINRYFPEMDLYIVIQANTLLDVPDYTDKPIKQIMKRYEQLIKNYPNTYKVQYVPDEPETVFNNIIKIIHDNLPRCGYCGKHYRPTNQYRKYHSSECKKKAWEDQNQENNRRQYHKYKHTKTEKQKGALGSRGANLHGKPDPNPVRELEKVRNAKRAMGLL